MYKNVKIAAVIPARKGSKGIPGKNIRKLNGTPLIGYTIKQAMESLYIDTIIVSTDSQEIIDLSRQFGIEVKGLRPEELATDSAIIYDVMKYELLATEISSEDNALAVLLQPTSPLRESWMIDEAIKKFIDEGQVSAVGVSPVEEHPLFMRTIGTDGQLVPLLETDSTVRRQELPSYYKVNGMIYINRVSDILAGYVSFNDNKSPIIIQREFSIELDTMDDWIKAENLISLKSGQ